MFCFTGIIILLFITLDKVKKSSYSQTVYIRKEKYCPATTTPAAALYVTLHRGPAPLYSYPENDLPTGISS